MTLEPFTSQQILKILWWLHRGQIGWQSALLGVATQDEIDSMNDWEDKYQRILDGYVKYYFQEELPRVKKQVAEFDLEFEESWKNEKKLAYLDFRMVSESKSMVATFQENQQLAKRDVPYWFRSLLLEDAQETDKFLKKHTFEKRLIMYPQQKNKNGVSPEEIAKAKDFPFEQLIELNRSHMAKCPFHADKNPSFLVKNNFGYCFSCGKSWDTIAFVMERDKKGFIETVRSLI